VARRKSAAKTRPSEVTGTKGASPNRIRLWYGALAAVLIAAYANHFQNGFHFDDFHTIVNNPFIRELGNIRRFFTDPTIFSIYPDHATWRPMVSTSLAVDYWLGHSLDPFYFHLSTFLWYGVQLLLMFLLFRRLMDAADPHPSNAYTALFAAAVYGLHPANAETVNYVIQRGDLYSTLGIVASLLWFIARPSQRKFGWYLLPAIGAYLSKAPALIYPAILVAYLVVFEGPEGAVTGGWGLGVRGWGLGVRGWGLGVRGWGIGRAVWRAVPALVVTAIAAVLTKDMTPPTFWGGAASGWRYRVTQPWVALHYLKVFFLPTDLSADTDWGYVSSPVSPEALAGYFAVAGLVALGVRLARNRETRPVSFGIWWFLLALLPTSLMPLAEVTNDHRMFFPFVGLALAVAWSLRLILFRQTARLTIHRDWVRMATAAALIVLALFANGTRERNEVWHSEESLWRDVTIKSPHNGRGLMNYGLIFMARGDYATALSYYQRALAYTPNYWSLEVNMATALGGVHSDAEAERHFRRALALAPGVADPYFYFGRWLKSVGRLDESAAQLETAVRLNRLSFDARHLLMEVYSELRNWPALDRLIADTLAITPDDETARQFMVKAQFRGREWQYAESVAQMSPTPENWLELSHQYYLAGRYADCIAAAKHTLELRPGFAEAYNNLAAAYNSLQRWDEGIEAATEAVRLKPGDQLARNNLQWALDRKKARR
jgi:tetratricopeptide (TPR) repeat protein